MGTEKKQQNSSAAFKVGAVSLAFLIIGYQAAIFVHRAAQLRIEANRDAPDTVYVYVGGADAASGGKLLNGADAASGYKLLNGADAASGGKLLNGAGTARGHEKLNETGDRNEANGRHGDGERGDERGRGSDRAAACPREERHYAQHSPAVEKVRDATRQTESFRFNPNTADIEEFKRLGFSQKQAQSLINYREKGGRFRRKEDFAKSFVVADSVYERLEPYIDIPLLDINKADSAAFDALPGIGPWFASKMVQYRKKIGGYTATEQLMDIDRFDSERFEALRDLITCGPRTSDDDSE